MGHLDELRGKTVYLDSNLFIYAVEGFTEHADFTAALFAAIDRKELRAVTSELTLAEVLTKPIELGLQDVAAVYMELIQDSDRLAVVPIDRAILIEAARLRSSLPDAIHVATAMLAACELFLTNDQRIRTPDPLPLRMLG